MFGKQKLFGCLVVMLVASVACENNVAGSRISSHDNGSWPESFGLGRTASDEEISRLDADVRPDGTGLPKGSGNFLAGKKIYQVKCAHCHGKTGTEGPYNKLVQYDLEQDEKTIGNYWPYASTLFDYINRAMPYDKPGSLSQDEVYSITLFLLARNNVVDSSIVLNSSNLPNVFMPAQKDFIQDDREETSEVR